MQFRVLAGALLLVSLSAEGIPAADKPTRDEAFQAIRKTVAFYHGQVARHGGYVYKYSGDLTLREAEGKAGPTVIWVQPPGTPLVGEAFLDAYEATRDARCLQAAKDAAGALVRGQLHSGGWFYSVDFDPARRSDLFYRCDLQGKVQPDSTAIADRQSANGWDDWKRRKYKGNISTFDDDTTQAAMRFLMRLDRVLEFKDTLVHDAVEYGLKALLGVQYPSGGFSANFDRFPEKSPDAMLYPVKRATIPKTWPATWPKDFTGCYVTNDDLMFNVIVTLLRAHETYRDKKYLAAAEKAGDFLLLAQLPEPQPAWAQQYNRDMQPVWDRAFEPPAITGRESQTILEALLQLYRVTGKERYLEPVPRAIAYFRKSALPDGRLARFYELQTNKPVYFTRDAGGKHQMTYNADKLATNYAFMIESRLDAIEAEYRRLKEGQKIPAAKPNPELAAQAKRIMDSLDQRGAWVDRGRLPHHKVEPASGVIDSATFAGNIRILCRFLVAN